MEDLCQEETFRRRGRKIVLEYNLAPEDTVLVGSPHWAYDICLHVSDVAVGVLVENDTFGRLDCELVLLLSELVDDPGGQLNVVLACIRHIVTYHLCVERAGVR